jgi:hypothetical protein
MEIILLVTFTGILQNLIFLEILIFATATKRNKLAGAKEKVHY